MKIVLITNLYANLARGGAERIVEAEAKGLMAAGHEVVVITGVPESAIPKGICSPFFPVDCPQLPGMEDEPHAWRPSAGQDARVLKYYPPNTYFYSDDVKHGPAARLVWHVIDTWNGKSAAKLARILKQEKPDVVHTHNLMGLGLRVPAAIRALGLRHVHTVHDVQLIHPSGLLPAAGMRGTDRVVAAITSAATRPLIGSPAAVLFPSEYLKKLHEQYRFFPSSDRVVARNPAPVPAAQRPTPGSRFIFAGQLAAHKGVRMVLDVWPDVGAPLDIAGAGALEAEVKSRASANSGVTFLGKLDRDGMQRALAAAAYLVVPSLVVENAPSVILEALAAGTPVIAAAAGGIPELITEGKNGFLFTPGDRAGLLQAIARAKEAMPRWAELSENARRSVASFGIDRHVAALIDIYQTP